jgi:protocatechuate 3,4-dioxygenase, beta subunit
MTTLNRRRFVTSMALISASGLITAHAKAQMATPSDAEGPFYPITPQKDMDADLTRVQGKPGIAKGEIIQVTGRVVDTQFNPIEDATIDLWQANSFGKYHHPHDNSAAPIDEHFQGWAIMLSGKNGAFTITTVMPGAYPLGSNNPRTPHIHLKVSKLGYVELLTQMYFPNQPPNAQDGLFKRKSIAQQRMMTAKQEGDTNSYRYDIVLEKV